MTKIETNLINQLLCEGFLKEHCRMSHLDLIPVRIGSGRHPLQDEDHSGSSPISFPGFLCLNSGMSPKRARSEPGLVGSEKIHLVLIGRPK